MPRKDANLFLLKFMSVIDSAILDVYNSKASKM